MYFNTGYMLEDQTNKHRDKQSHRQIYRLTDQQTNIQTDDKHENR